MKIVICDDNKNICTLFAHKIKSIYPKADIKCLYDGELNADIQRSVEMIKCSIC